MAERTYRIGEAASLLNLKTYVLRFWETEFPQLVPLRTEKGQRLYTEADLALLRRIRFLLHERGLTIEGARRMLAERGGASASGANDLAVVDVAGLVGFGEDDPDDMALADLPGEGDSLADADAELDDASVAAPYGAGPASTASFADAQGSTVSAPASRVQAWDQYLHGLLLPDDAAEAPADSQHGHAKPRHADVAPASGGASPETMHAIIAELEALRRLLAGTD